MFSDLDKIDRRLLRELDLDSRQPLSKLGKKLRLGSDLVEYRVERLQRDLVIDRFTAYVDHHRLGKSLFKIYLRIGAKRQRVAELIQYLDQSEQVYWLAEWYGTWDLLFSFWAENARECQERCDQLLGKFNDVVLDIRIATVSETKRYSRTFGLDGGKRMRMYGKDRNKLKLDQLEEELLTLVNQNARVSYVELAAKLGTTANIVKYRLQKLEELGVIYSYEIQLNYQHAGILLLKLLVSLSSFTAKNEQLLKDFCNSHKMVTCLIRQIGSWPVEIEVEASSMVEFHEFMDELKAEFSGYIRNVDTLILRADHYHRL